MNADFNKIIFFIIIWPLAIVSNLKAETLDIKEILEIIQKDLRTLERAVYSESFSASSKSSSAQDATSENAEKEYPSIMGSRGCPCTRYVWLLCYASFCFCIII